MKRREFCERIGLGAAAALPLGARVKNFQSAILQGTVPSFPVSDWQAVVDEGWGTAGAAGGSGTWDGVTLNAPAIPGLAGDGPFKPE